jgi:hypothetical protein
VSKVKVSSGIIIHVIRHHSSSRLADDGGVRFSRTMQLIKVVPVTV